MNTMRIDDGLVAGRSEDFYICVYVGANALTLSARSCTLLEPEVSVDLRRVDTSSLAGVGSVDPNVGFTIALNCDSDMAVEMVVDTVNVQDAAAGILNLSSRCRGVDAPAR